jgi:flavin reductase (DIM6/NTAB) family NADH-FMN oxidoreductase RutF
MSKKKIKGNAGFPALSIAIVGANVNGVPNYMAVGFVGGVNVTPPIFMVSLNRNHHTPKGIIENGTFSINIPTPEIIVETDYVGLVSGRKKDKSKIFETFYGDLGTAPMITECAICYELEYLKKTEFVMDITYFGEVKNIYVDEKAYKDGKPDLSLLNPLIFSGFDGSYYKIGEKLGRAWKIGAKYNKEE